MKKLMIIFVLAVPALVGCASHSKIPKGYDVEVNYDFDQNRPEYKKHFHYGYVSDVSRVQLDEGIATGTVLTSLIGGDISEQKTVWRDLVSIVLPGNGKLVIVQEHNSQFVAGQEVKILGTGTSGRVIIDSRLSK